MPQFIVEYSTNLDGHVDMDGFVEAVRVAALESGMFPIGGIRVRATPVSIYAIGDGDPENAFIDIWLRIGKGRDMETKKRACGYVFDAMVAFLGSQFDARPLALSFDVHENESELSFKKNTMHERIKAKSA